MANDKIYGLVIGEINREGCVNADAEPIILVLAILE